MLFSQVPLSRFDAPTLIEEGAKIEVHEYSKEMNLEVYLDKITTFGSYSDWLWKLQFAIASCVVRQLCDGLENTWISENMVPDENSSEGWSLLANFQQTLYVQCHLLWTPVAGFEFGVLM